MAASKRDNGMARTGLLLGTLLAAAGFWVGIVTGPQPDASTVRPAETAQVITSSSVAQSRLSEGRGQRLRDARQASSQLTPRLRTRGS